MLPFVNVLDVQIQELFLSLDSWHAACQVPYLEVSMLIYFKQKNSVAKVVHF